MLGICNREIARWDQRVRVRQQVLKRLGNNFFKSSDFTLLEDKVFKPNILNFVDIGLPDELDPYIDLPSYALFYAYPSTRSRYAQLGLGVQMNAGVCIAENLKLSEDFGYKAQLRVLNYTPQEILLKAGSKLGRLYDWNGERVTGYELQKLVIPEIVPIEQVQPNAIHIDGKQGIDWEYEYSRDDCRGIENIVGVRVRIKPERFWLPKISNSPISISDTRRDFRTEIDQLLHPIPTTQDWILWIGETVHMQLGSNINGILYEAVYPNVRDWKETSRFDTHIPSLLIDAGSNWPIRVEVLSPTVSDRIPNFVSFYFVQNQKQTTRP